MKIGLLMTRDDTDILADTLNFNSTYVDCFYVLDGSEDYKTTESICMASSKCAGYWRDVQCPYEGPPKDGWRQFLYSKAGEDNGYDHWFLLLHGDELWVNDPDEAIEAVPDADGFEFMLPFAIPRRWDYGLTAYEQLKEFVFPGWPEFRMFLGGETVYFLPHQHHFMLPQGLDKIVRLPWPIFHYPYRSPEVQRARAANKTWSSENFDELRETGAVFWDEDRLDALMKDSLFYKYAGIVSGL